jgi:AbrB family looped-hinge helix DNA binding protein
MKELFGMWEAKVTFKGQVTIPKAVRTALSINDGDSVLFAVEGGQAILRPLKTKSLQELYGALPATRPYPGLEPIRQAVRKRRHSGPAQGTASGLFF